MAKAFLFHNPRCSKSRQALKLLEQEKENFEVFMYLDEKIEKDFLKEIIQKLGKKYYPVRGKSVKRLIEEKYICETLVWFDLE